MRQNLLRLAAKQKAFDTFSAMRGHGDKITFFRHSGVDDRLIGLRAAHAHLAIAYARLFGGFGKYAKERLAANKYPREIRIVDQVPLTSVGKLDRKRLRDQVRAGGTPA